MAYGLSQTNKRAPESYRERELEGDRKSQRERRDMELFREKARESQVGARENKSEEENRYIAIQTTWTRTDTQTNRQMNISSS